MATQWDIVSRAVAGPRAAFQELIRQAAQAPLLHRDDTPMKVLSLMAERARAEADGGKPVAKAINTSGIVAVLEQHKVVLCSSPATITPARTWSGSWRTVPGTWPRRCRGATRWPATSPASSTVSWPTA